MAPSSNAERGGGGGGKRGPGGAAAGSGPRARREHLLRQLQRGRLYGQLSPRLFRKLPPRVCVSLKSIVDEELLRVGHIFLGFSKCGRYVLSYTSNSSDDDLSFYIYHLYWWEFNVHSKLKLVRQVRLFQDEEIYSDLYLTVCEWPSDTAKVIVFGFNTRSATGLLLNMMMLSDENHRDIYISIVATPAPLHCALCRAALPPPGTTPRQCLCHGFMLHTKYQVVYPFPTFQPAFQLKRDHVVLLNTSYSLVACAVAVRAAGDAGSNQILYGHRSPPAPAPPRVPEEEGGGQDPAGGLPAPAPSPSPAVAKAKEFVADLFRRAKGGPGPGGAEDEDEDGTSGTAEGPPPPSTTPPPEPGRCPPHPTSPPGLGAPPGPPEPGYINYTQLRYVLEPGPAEEELEDDKISLPFLVTDLRGRSLKPLKERAVAPEQFLAVEQLTLDFEYVINEVIRQDAAWARQFCSFSDYDIVILEVCPDTNQVVINIGLLLLAFPSPDEEGQLRPRSYHTSLKVAWDLNTGAFVTVGVGDLTEVKGQTSGSVWSGYRKGCVDTVMRWLVPESSARYVNRMTNEALHKGCSLKVLADNERYTWIVL
ncbi:DDB1- and CUL4-associated factor 15 [Neopsephotus bourkii]|uniref:DDB1- and CUL4-associated factor 15 n=1 Tax=Neopsephotus bourkii TaxID=309878 RepID=UPI002AA58F85|nr:DDB1- and CUL4-associated factor 15 [Neopsephotus bourkii]